MFIVLEQYLLNSIHPVERDAHEVCLATFLHVSTKYMYNKHSTNTPKHWWSDCFFCT